MNENLYRADGYLARIESPRDLKSLSFEELEQLADEIRSFLIKSVSKTGGHIASNLGVVELTIALHKVLNAPLDKIIWDVGHQTYVHKILTGRKDVFDTLRQIHGISGFPKTQESPYDAFNTGHSSTSISAALGMARARDLKGEKYTVAAVIGDGSLTGGMAFEALNDAGISGTKLLIILNDNGMSIAPNVGGLSRYLSRIRVRPFYYKTRESLQALVDSMPRSSKRLRKFVHKLKAAMKSMFVPAMFFEDLGFRYFGPIDGHNIREMAAIFEQVKTMKGPVLVHVTTTKGKGYKFAEEHPDRFHGIAPFEIETGQVLQSGSENYSSVFGNRLCDLAQKENNIVAISAAMSDGTGLRPFRESFPKRFFDVGIAEQHAVTLAAGFAIAGTKPVVAIYSTFLQRAYDQILHDVALQKLHVVFAVDRAGVAGADGETHQGIYDVSFLYTIPHLAILAPASPNELKEMLDYAVMEHTGPIAIRYPRGSGVEFDGSDMPLRYGKGVLIKEGRDVTLIGAGSMLQNTLEAAELLEKEGVSCEVINPRFLRPVDDELILGSARKTGYVVIVQDVIQNGGFGSTVAGIINDGQMNAHTMVLGLPDRGIEHGKRSLIYKEYGLDANGIKMSVLSECRD
ncbi:MAG TPA: 1-deoxy-D-xylulose-5-phosphate synthase [Ruminiclostridium sp.]|nr:1-deoxy-D-xylulose-5-phosphate synthase [Ruminiclostridium sp.]